jgi:voltage-gated potassium channel
MASQHILSTVLLIAATVGIHGAGTLVVFCTLFRIRTHSVRHFGFIHNTIVLTLVIVALMAVHMTEVVCWASFYSHEKCFSDFSTSVYFSLASYTTVGDGDVVLRDPGWRLLGGVEALTAALMMCWSTVILIHVLTKIYTRHVDDWEEKELLARERIHHPGPRR